MGSVVALSPHRFLLVSALLSLICVGITNAAYVAMSVDLGSQYLKIGLVKPGVPMETVLNKESQRKTASLIGFHNGERLFGEVALQMSYKHPDRVFPFLIDLLGKKFDDPIVQEYIKEFPYVNLSADPDTGDVVCNTKSDGSYSVETLVGMMLWNAKEQAAAYGKTPIRDTVLVVPAYFNQTEKKAVANAAEIAGLNLLQLMSDGASTSLNYAFTRRKEITETAQHLLIYDIGASNTVATVVQLKLEKYNGSESLDPLVSVKGVGYARSTGGRHLTAAFRDYLAEAFAKTHKTNGKVTENLRAMAKLLKEAERVKHILSANTETYAQIESLFEDQDFRHKVNRDIVNNLLKEHEEDFVKPVADALEMAQLTVDNIDQVVLFGAGTRIPKIQENLREYFKGKEPNRFLNTDESATLGALYRAATISKGFKVKNINVEELKLYEEEPLAEATDAEKKAISEAKKILNTYEKAEIEKTKREKAHNELEARVYDIKDRLSSEQFATFSRGNEIENLTELVTAASQWLEDEVDVTTTTEQFLAKRAPIDAIVKAIRKRARDFEQRPKLLKHYRSSLEKLEDYLSKMKAEESKGILEEDDFEKPEETLKNNKEWAAERLPEWKPKEDDDELNDDLRRRGERIDRVSNELVMKFTRKLKEIEKIAKAAAEAAAKAANATGNATEAGVNGTEASGNATVAESETAGENGEASTDSAKEETKADGAEATSAEPEHATTEAPAAEGEKEHDKNAHVEF